MAEDLTRLERLATAGLPHTILEPISRGARDPDSGVGELAYAARALPRTEWSAFLYLFRHDHAPEVVADLRAWLLVVASDLYVRERWPTIERGRSETRYLQRLCDLVLLVAQQSKTYGSPQARARAYGVDLEAWLVRLERPYRDLAAAFKGLELRAAVHMSGQAEE